MTRVISLISTFLLLLCSGQLWACASMTASSYGYDSVEYFVVDRNTDSEAENQHYDDTLSFRYCCNSSLNDLQKNSRLGSFFTFIDGFFATKSVKPTLSTLHARGTKIPGGRKVGDTLAGSNKIKNASGDTFKRVDFAPSKPHNGLSPHTHPNFRNQLPDGTIRSGVSRNAGPVTRRDIIDAARQGSQRTGGL